MAEHLKTTETDLPEQVSGMQRIRRRVESDVCRHLRAGAALRQSLAIGGVMDEPTRSKFGNDITEFRHGYRVERAQWHRCFYAESVSSSAKAARTQPGTGTTLGAPGVVDTYTMVASNDDSPAT